MVKVNCNAQFETGDLLKVVEPFQTWSAEFEVGDIVEMIDVSYGRGISVKEVTTGVKATEVASSFFELETKKSEVATPSKLNGSKENDEEIIFPFEKGDVLISTEPHSCDVVFVEEVNAEAILLVNGVEDAIYYVHEIPLLEKKFRLLCKKGNREDL